MTADAIARAELLANEPMRPAGPRPGFVFGTVASFKDILAHHELLKLLTKRELKARYKDSILGFFWSMMRPLTQLLIYYVAIGQILGANRGITDFAVFVYCGLALWTFFQEMVQTGTASIVGNAGLVKKIYLPRELFPLSAIGSALFNFAIQMIFVVVSTLLVGKIPTGARLIYIPLSILVIVVFGTALTLLLSAINVYLRDVQYLVEVALMVLFWCSPICYSYSMIVTQSPAPWLTEIYTWNPVTLAVLGFQKAFWVAGDYPNPNASPPLAVWPPHLAARMVITIVVSLLALWLCQRIFSRLQADFAQEL